MNKGQNGESSISSRLADGRVKAHSQDVNSPLLEDKSTPELLGSSTDDARFGMLNFKLLDVLLPCIRSE
ncbi:hypothetical protein SK128_028638 [Halocaridina rubra]|uniref:Uncharacterized protein n=1 Tax=Halocaridina rubra TaxID=373956 RepID=A0AAN8XG17_HALRR